MFFRLIHAPDLLMFVSAVATVTRLAGYGRPSRGTEWGVGVVAREVLITLERVKDDGAERGPAGKGRWAAPQRVCSRCHVWEIAAGLWAGFVDHAQITVEKDASLFRTPQDS